MKTLLVFNGNPVFDNGDGSYYFLAPFAVDSDGTGPSHGDKYQQKQTALRIPGPNGSWMYLNASEDPYGVSPPRIIRAVPGIVLGCQLFVRNPRTGQIGRAVMGDTSDDAPTRKLGEGSIALATLLDVDPDPVTGGSDELFEWTFIPGVPARCGQKTYPLQRFGT